MAPLRRFWAFPLHHSTTYDPKFSTVSTGFFRRVGRGVGQATEQLKETLAPIRNKESDFVLHNHSESYLFSDNTIPGQDCQAIEYAQNLRRITKKGVFGSGTVSDDD